MTVVGSASEAMRGRQGAVGENGLRGYTRIFDVHTNSRYDDETIVLAATGLPRMYNDYITTTSSDPGCKVVGIFPRQDENTPRLWRVEVIYSSQYERIDHPLTELPEIQWSSEHYKEPLPGVAALFYDTKELVSPDSEGLANGTTAPPQNLRAWGRGITNSAGHPYNPPAERDASRPIVSVTRNQAQFDTAFKVQFQNSVNQFPWNGLQARQAMCRDIDAQTLLWKSNIFNIPDIAYYRVSYTFALKAETWDLQLLDFGPYYLVWSQGGQAPQRIPFTTDDGTPRMGLLDNSNPQQPGQKLAEGGDPKFNRFPAYRETDFAGMNIVLNLALANVRTPIRA